MILKNKIIFGTTGFLVASGVTALIVILATSDDDSSPEAKVKIKLDESKLSSDSFKASGTQTLGVVNLKSGVTLPKQIELKYFVGANIPTNDNTYTTNKPSNLKNGDIVYVKPFIKKASISSHAFKAKVNPIKFVVSGLPLTAISSSLLTKDSFVISGVQTQGMIKKKNDVTLPSEVEARYFKGASATKLDESYKLSILNDLSNGDKVHIKFFIKNEYITTHKFADDFTNLLTLPIDTLPKIEIDSSLLVRDSFVISGVQTQGMIKKKVDVILPSEIEARYFKGASASKLDESYKLSILNDLSNGDKVHIKFFIKNEYITTHKFVDDFTNLLTLPIDTLPKVEIDSSLLVRDSFLISGSESQGTIKKKARATLPTEVEIKYFKGSNAPSQDSAYESQVPTNLSNGDNVHIKFFIKLEYIATHKFASDFLNLISISVEGLKTLIDDRALTKSSFEFRNAPSKTIKWKIGVILPDQLVIKYYKSLLNTRPSSDNDYKTNVPTNLSEGDHIYIKFFIKEEHKNTYKFANGFENFIHFEVKNNRFKSIINILNLKTSSFQTSGNNGTGIVQWNDKIRLPNEVEIKYAKIASEPIHNNQYNPIAPTNLSNGDIIYIKFFIKNGFSTSHEFPTSGFENPVKFAIKGLKNLIDHRNLKKSSFEVTRTQGTGIVQWNDKMNLPSEVEIKYAKIDSKPNHNNEYNPIAPNNLSNGDIIYIKFFIKNGFNASHEFPTSGFQNPVKFVIKGLKTLIDNRTLKKSSFEVTGMQGTGQIGLKSEIVLPRQVEVKYYKSISPPLSDSNYLVTLHSDLNNDDIVHIKFFIKNNYLTTHKFPDGFDNPIIYTIKNLKTLIDISKLTSSAFVITTARNLKTINKNDDVLLPQQVEAKYYKSTSNPTKLAKNKKYSTNWPTSFGDGEIVSIRFFIKEKYLATHQFPTNFNNDVTIAFNDVTLKTVINDAKLVKSSFQVRGSENIGILEFKDPTSLPNAVEIRYLKESVASNDDEDYRSVPPVALKNGDIVWIKFFIKDDFKTNHQFRAAFNPLIRYEVQDLKNLINDSVLVKESFAITGKQTTGAINWRTGQNVPVLPEALEVRYFKGTAIPSGDDAYKTSPPINLSNSDIIHIKFFIKTSHALTHKFRAGFANALKIVIRNLPKIEVTSMHLNPNAFTIAESAGNKKLELKKQNGKSLLPAVIEVKYHRGNAMPSSDNDYSKTPLIFLGGVRTAYIKFFIKSNFAQTHKLANDLANPLCLWVTPLDEIVRLTRDLQKESFIVVPSNSARSLAKAKLKDDIALPSFIHPLYAVRRSDDEAIPTSFSKTVPDDLRNGDQVYVKFGYNENLFGGFLPNFQNEPFALEVVAGLEKFTIESISLPAIQSSWFTFANRTVVPNISGVNLPAEVQFLYAMQRKGNANIPQDNAYSPSPPTMLRNGDKVYVKYGIRENFKASHQFELSYVNISKSIIVSDIVLTEIDVANLNLGAIKIILGTRNEYYRRLFAITRTNLPIPSQVKIQIQFASSLHNLPKWLGKIYLYDRMQIRFVIKSAYLTTHIFPDDFQKQISFRPTSLKSVIDTTHLRKESFEITPSNQEQTLAKVQVRDGISLPALAHPLFAVQKQGDSAVPNSYTRRAPTNLKNGDRVYIKFAIIGGAYARFASGFRNTPFALDPIEGLNETIIKSSALPAIDSNWFAFTDRTIVTNITGVSLPSEVQFLYAVQRKGNANIPQSKAYKLTVPTMLRNGDKVYVKYGIRDNFKASHQFELSYANIPKSIIVSGIVLTEIDVTNLNLGAIKIVIGTRWNRRGWFAITRTNLPIASQVRIKIQRSSYWYNNFPKWLGTSYLNDRMQIRFVIKSAYLTTHIFPDDFQKQISFSPTSLKSVIDTTHLRKESFEITPSNQEQTLAKVQVRDGISLPALAHPLFAVQKQGDSAVPNSYTRRAPTNLKNGDRVYIKFAIIDGAYASFGSSFANEPFALDPIEGLNETIINSSTLAVIDSSWFTIANRTVVTNIGEISLPKGAIIVYAVQRKGNANIPQDNVYSPSPPTMLENDDKIYIKYRARNDLEVGYKIDPSYSNTPIVITVSGIVITKIDVTKLNLNAINISWRSGKQTFWISRNSNWKIPEQVKIESSNNGINYYDLPKYYAKGNMTKQHYIRFVIKPTHLSYIFPENFTNVIRFAPSSRKTIIDTNLQQESFKIVPNVESTLASIDLQDGVTLPFRIHVLYGVKRKDDSAIPTSYSKNAPNDLKNGDRVYVKYEIDQYAYASFGTDFANEPFALDPIEGLNETIINSSTLPVIDSSWFTIANRTVVTNIGEVSLPKGAIIVYAVQRKGITNIPQDNVYSPSPPTMLENDDKIYIKYRARNDLEVGYKIDPSYSNTPIVITVSGIVITKIDVTKLNLNAINISWRYGKKTFWISRNSNWKIPEQVKIESSNNGINYYDLPKYYAKGNMAKQHYIRFVIKPTHLSYIFPENFTNVIRFAPSSRKTIIDTNLQDESFKIVPNVESTLASIDLQDGVTLPFRIHVLYGVKRKDDSAIPTSYSKIAPNDLKNGDQVYVKYEINQYAYASFKSGFTNEPFGLIPISGLIDI